MFGSKRRIAQKLWDDWNHTAHLFKYAEQDLRNVRADPHRVIHSLPAWLCTDVSGVQPISLQVNLELSRIRAFKVRALSDPQRPMEFIDVMEWPFDRYAVTVSEDNSSVRFGNDDPEDPGNSVYVRAGVHRPEDLGWWTTTALRARHLGIDRFLLQLRNDRVNHLRSEPDCPFKPSERRKRMGNVDELPPLNDG